ncbi:MAG: hypothetical protein H6719_25660 [Sandaracinaceae bacterium]|nr:hypothetical protein [Sandaracinaceae bacterium]
MTRRLTALVGVLALGCATPAEAGAPVLPGRGIGAVRLEMTLSDVRAALGEPRGALVTNRIGFARFDGELEIVFTSPEADTLTDDAIVVGIGASEGADLAGAVVPGASRADIEAAMGPAPDVIESLEFYPEGLSLEYDGDVVLRVGVIAPYERFAEVPAMTGATR